MNDFTFSQLEYIRPDYDKLKEECLSMVDEIQNAKEYSDIQLVLKKRDEVLSTVFTMSTIAYIRNTLDTTDEFYEKEVEYNDEYFAAACIEITKLSKALLWMNSSILCMKSRS